MAMLDDSSIRQLPHEQPVSAVVAALGADLQAGFTSQEAQKRQKFYGLNTLRAKAHIPTWKRLLAQFHDPQVYLLLGAAAVTILVSKLEGGSGISYEALIILAIGTRVGIPGKDDAGTNYRDSRWHPTASPGSRPRLRSILASVRGEFSLAA
jgi:hypothetical protein